MSNYDDMAPDELVAEGDECCGRSGTWFESENWVKGARKQSPRLRYRRPVEPIQDRLQALAVEMNAVAMLMLADDQSLTMQAKGVELQGASATISEWLESMRAEETIQGFVEGRKA